MSADTQPICYYVRVICTGSSNLSMETSTSLVFLCSMVLDDPTRERRFETMRYFQEEVGLRFSTRTRSRPMKNAITSFIIVYTWKMRRFYDVGHSPFPRFSSTFNGNLLAFVRPFLPLVGWLEIPLFNVEAKETKWHEVELCPTRRSLCLIFNRSVESS